MMIKSRVSIFEDVPDLDLASFAPKSTVDVEAPSPEKVRKVAEAAKFVSREPAPAKTEKSSKRPARVYRTGRNVQFEALKNELKKAK